MSAIPIISRIIAISNYAEKYLESKWLYKYQIFKNIFHRIVDNKTRVAYNCIEGNNCARVNRIFITPRAIRESSADQYASGKRDGQIKLGFSPVVSQARKCLLELWEMLSRRYL